MTMSAKSPARIALIHATALAMRPIHAAFQRHWPQAHCMNLLDDSLSVDRAQAGQLTDAMVQRFVDLASYAQRAGCSGMLFTCSAFGPAIEAAARATGLPTLKPNEAMFEQALALNQTGRPLKLGLLATFQASIPSMAGELQQMAQQRGIAVELHSVFVPEAMDDLAQGRTGTHHRKVAGAAAALADCDAVMLAQFSMADAAADAQAQLPCPVLSSPDCAVLSLMQRMPDA
jgi:hypothetical protein